MKFLNISKWNILSLSHQFTKLHFFCLLCIPNTNTWVFCGPGLHAWSAEYPLAGPQVRKSAGPQITRGLLCPHLKYQTTVEMIACNITKKYYFCFRFPRFQPANYSDTADVWLPLPTPTPLSTVAVVPRNLPPLMLLQSAFADRYDALCNEANSSWHDPHWADINEHQLSYKLSTYSGILSFGILGIHLQLAPSTPFCMGSAAVR